MVKLYSHQLSQSQVQSQAQLQNYAKVPECAVLICPLKKLRVGEIQGVAMSRRKRKRITLAMKMLEES